MLFVLVSDEKLLKIEVTRGFVFNKRGRVGRLADRQNSQQLVVKHNGFGYEKWIEWKYRFINESCLFGRLLMIQKIKHHPFN
ncbi:hypothetical protein [Aquibacillus saliphilus]|uniref:hypothetical protein n=1 Tax=Aquibacillus saliphilus TaxID=1909422 RepID=UPI001CF0685B|nr:hypothetical protein [Aquibacillus saliphilus]